jgi:hypothetical protein
LVYTKQYRGSGLAGGVDKRMDTRFAGLIIFQLITLIIINLKLNIHDPHSRTDTKLFTQFH